MVFLKSLKLIDGKKYIAIAAYSPKNSEFVFILTTLKIIIVRKLDFIKHFHKFRTEYKNTYSITYSL